MAGASEGIAPAWLATSSAPPLGRDLLQSLPLDPEPVPVDRVVEAPDDRAHVLGATPFVDVGERVSRRPPVAAPAAGSGSGSGTTGTLDIDWWMDRGSPAGCPWLVRADRPGRRVRVRPPRSARRAVLPSPSGPGVDTVAGHLGIVPVTGRPPLSWSGAPLAPPVTPAPRRGPKRGCRGRGRAGVVIRPPAASWTRAGRRSPSAG